MRKLLLLLLFLPVLLALRPGTTYPWTITSNIVYGPMPSETLDLCVPVGASTARPGVVFIHGGGWTSGDKTQDDGPCKKYASLGFDAITINYRLTSAGYQWPDQIGDVQLAVRYFRSIAASINLDPARLCAFGDSAGAHLSLLLDTLQAIHPSDVSGLYPTVSPSVMCVADQFGPSDMTKMYDESSARADVVALLDNQTPTSDPAIYADASPVGQVTTASGQAYIVQGTTDTVVKPDQSLEMQAAFQAQGIPVIYESYVGGHEYGGLTPDQIQAIRLQLQNWLVSVEQP